jgi:hypothetical protein
MRDAVSNHSVTGADGKPTAVLGSTSGIDALERPNELRQIERGVDGIIEPIERRKFAGEPANNTPGVGIALSRYTCRDR